MCLDCFNEEGEALLQRNARQELALQVYTDYKARHALRRLTHDEIQERDNRIQEFEETVEKLQSRIQELKANSIARLQHLTELEEENGPKATLIQRCDLSMSSP